MCIQMPLRSRLRPKRIPALLFGASLLGASLLASVPAVAAPADPLGSPMWAMHAAAIFGKAPVVFDSRVVVALPSITENQHVYPLTVDARALPQVQRIVVLADLDPIPVALDYRLHGAAPFVALRIKLDQKTPVRAAVLTADGVWHVAGQWADAAGGGCSAPPLSRVKGDWADHLGELRGAAWRDADGTRLRFTLRHPMDTGLVENIPAYNLERVMVSDAGGAVLGEMLVNGSVAEDPALTVILPAAARAPFAIAALDTNGRSFAGRIPAAKAAIGAVALFP